MDVSEEGCLKVYNIFVYYEICLIRDTKYSVLIFNTAIDHRHIGQLKLHKVQYTEAQCVHAQLVEDMVQMHLVCFDPILVDNTEVERRL